MNARPTAADIRPVDCLFMFLLLLCLGSGCIVVSVCKVVPILQTEPESETGTVGTISPGTERRTATA